IYPLMQLWGFSTKEYHIPTPEELAEYLPLADASKIEFDGQSVRLAEGQAIDFGGIAKGYAAQRAIEIFQSYGVVSGMVSLGGNIQVLGAKPGGADWRIGIRDPEGSQGAVLAVVPVQDRALVTSGGYERYFEENGETYIHILDPRTGCPAETDLLSVTVVAADGMLADGLSTSLFIMGSTAAVDYWRAEGCAFDMVLVTADRSVLVTEGISGGLQSEAAVQILYPMAG
ncbi:MAG: FAD:protein FMN transferase, partial [Oscillospiraceae bacterium]|nr:FAD:protein FMN transferase [Oscillospiraceae bacterium]